MTYFWTKIGVFLSKSMVFDPLLDENRGKREFGEDKDWRLLKEREGAEGESYPEEVAEHLTDGHDGGNLPERSAQDAVADDDDVADDWERRAEGEPCAATREELTHSLEATRIGPRPAEHLLIAAQTAQEVVDQSAKPVANGGHDEAKPDVVIHEEQSREHHLRIHREWCAGKKCCHEKPWIAPMFHE